MSEATNGARGVERHTFRAPVLSSEGVVATPHYLASLAGVEALRDGGTAVDAAVAASLVLGVVWPHMCGPGGDLFAQVWDARTRRLIGLNASGRAGAAMSTAAYRERGLSSMPQRGPLAVTVPGAVDGWFALHQRWGRLDPPRVFRDAIRHAEQGHAVTRRVARAIEENARLLSEGGAAGEVFLPGGRAPAAGERLRQLDLAQTLRHLADAGPQALYRGVLGERIATYLQAEGGLLRGEDFADHRSEWVEPLRYAYRGATVAELPPNTQGIAVLQMVGMLADDDPRAWGFASADLLHQLVERKKLAFADRDRYVADPACVDVPITRLLDPDYLRARAREVGTRASHFAAPGGAGDGDTVYLCTADRDGNVVSLIQSLFNAWGSGLLVPGTGVVLQNRGFSFKLDEAHPNSLAPGKRPMHTLIPGFALDGDEPAYAFGTRGADGQPQTAVQLLVDMLDFGLDPQQAVEAPRWVHGAPSARFPRAALVLESRFDRSVGAELERRGHQVIATEPLDDVMGTAQVIHVDRQRGCFVAGSDPRGDGTALAV